MGKISSICKMADIYVHHIRKLATPSAGMLFYCPDDQTVLLTKRSDDMSSPGTWDIQGGRHDEGDDSALETATREAKEEIKNLPKRKLIGKHTLAKNPKGVEYVIHIYSVSNKEKEKWTPKIDLNHESEKYKWFPYDKLPKKTHFDLSWLKKTIEELE